MKVEIILAIVWMSFCVCERQQRSTVLTDESKRILEQFDFSNFDKQEGLNYIDRQRYENQIRGKRSHPKLKRNHDGKNEKVLDIDTQFLHPSSDGKRYGEVKLHLRSERIEKSNNKRMVSDLSGSPGDDITCRIAPIAAFLRVKRVCQCKKNQKCKPACGGKKRWRKKSKRKRKQRYWSPWNEWSPCSVTCGRGRKIRWRKCIAKNCITAEFEMGEKTCQLPACNLLTRFLGLH